MREQLSAAPRRVPLDPDVEPAVVGDTPRASRNSTAKTSPASGSRSGEVKLAAAEQAVDPAVGGGTDAADDRSRGEWQFIDRSRPWRQPRTPLSAPQSTPAQIAAAATPIAASGPEPQQLDWREHLDAAIAQLETENTEPPATTTAIGRHAALRLLYLADGRRDAALKPIAGIPPVQQDFWSKELFALTTYLDTERTADESRRAAAASVPLREAAARLGELATLSVHNLAFCSEVTSYGVYKKFPQYEFRAGQEVLLYAEVENFKSVQTEKGYHTSLKSSYEILDSRGARVDQKEFEITVEYCQNPRRDYFIRYFVWMPKRIYGGTYTLQLSIEDTQSQKIGQSSIDFTIHEKDN